MCSIKPILFFRFILLILIILFSILIYECFFHQKIIQKEGWLQLLANQRKIDSCEILYFSASPNQASAPSDTSRHFISQLLESEIKRKIHVFDTGAIHAGVFLHVLKNMTVKPKVVFVDLNLRSFGNQWIHSELENSLQRNMAYWNSNFNFLNRINVVLKNYNYVPLTERKNKIYYDEKFSRLSNNHTIKTWVDSLFISNKENTIGREMIKHFAFEISQSNSMLKNYHDFFKYCESHNIKVVATILPENIEGMSKLAGNDLKKICTKNVNFLKNQFKYTNVYLLDLHSNFEESYFFEDFPTEHYVFKGRKEIAKNQAFFYFNSIIDFKSTSNIIRHHTN